jgi:hypothetical protein
VCLASSEEGAGERFPFDSVQALDPMQRTVTLRIDSTAVDRSNPP